MTHNIIAYFHKYDWLCSHLYNNFGIEKRWPSDKANHTCENMLYINYYMSLSSSKTSLIGDFLALVGLLFIGPALFLHPGFFVYHITTFCKQITAL